LAQVGGASRPAAGPAKTAEASEGGSDIGPALERWAVEASARLLKANTTGNLAEFQKVAEEAELGAEHAPTPRTQAILLVTAAMARTALFHLGQDKKGNGTRAFHEFKEAYGLAPGRKEAATGWGQTVLALGHQGFFTRKFLGLLGVSVSKDDAREVIGSLGAFPDDPLSQLLRGRLSAWCKDKEAADAAAAAMKALRAKGGDSAVQVDKMEKWLAGLEKAADSGDKK
jgi:hypothetical protein